MTFSRKQALANIGRGALAGTLIASLGTAPTIAEAKGISDTDILNFALNLEYLEAEFYSYAVNGLNLAAAGMKLGGSGTSGPTVGGAKVAMSDAKMLAITQQIAYDETTHVALLRSVLGKDAIAKPAINLEALNLGFRSPMEFLTLARAFEDVGVSAYGGAAPLISSKETLATAARILAAEAEHTGAIRTLAFQHNVTTPTLDAKDIAVSTSSPLSLDKQGLSIVRTPMEVLAIVKPFFPNGLNGAIK